MRLWTAEPDRPSFFSVFETHRQRRIRAHTSLSPSKLMIMVALAFITLLFAGPAMARPVIRALHQIRQDVSGLGILQMAFSVKMAETVLAILSVMIVTVVYAFLIRRGPLMATTAMYPKRSIEANIGQLLSMGWPDSTEDTVGRSMSVSDEKKISSRSTTIDTKQTTPDSIRFFYLGRMNNDYNPNGPAELVAKGVTQCAALPVGKKHTAALWLTSGSPLTKDIVQLLVWEWTSLWLLALMITATLMYNGFFTNDLSLDSYPRLTVILIYAVSYLCHSFYVWNVSSSFFTNVASGASWSLLERAKFAIGNVEKLRRHQAGETFEFKSIDKASSEYIPTTFTAMMKHDIQRPTLDDPITTPLDDDEPEPEDPKDMRAALTTISAAQDRERKAATIAVSKAFDRVVSNAMVMMGVTLSTGFSSWTSSQATDNSPNNFTSSQIGSLALLASLSLGAATMFTSALHLSIMDSSYRTIVRLKETRMNGQAIDHYKKRKSRNVPLSFTEGTVPPCKVRFRDIFGTNRWRNFFFVLFLGPAFALLPRDQDHSRTSADVEFDFEMRVREREVLLTTRDTDKHARDKDGVNLEAINVCYLGESLGDEKERNGMV